VTMQHAHVDGRIDGLSFDGDGRHLAVVTDAGAVTLFDCSEAVRVVCSTETGLESCELAFHPREPTLVVTGTRIRDEIEGVVFAYPLPFNEGEAASIATIETMATAPTFTHGDGVVLLVGGYLRLLCLDGSTYRILNEQEGDDYVAPRGIAVRRRGEYGVAAWAQQGAIRLHGYGITRDQGLIAQAGPGPDEPEALGGLAFSPDGSYLAATFADPTELLFEATPPASAPYGHLSIYDSEGFERIGTHAINGSLSDDFVRYDYRPGQRREQNAEGQWQSVSIGFAAETPPSRPVFIDETKVAVGMPGGSVRIIDVREGIEIARWNVGFTVRAVDYSFRSNQLAAAGGDGQVAVWSVDIG
jgi:WD40 repeat protein